MIWCTSTHIQEIANNTGKPQFGWIPKGGNYERNIPLLWIRDPKGTIKHYRNNDPNFKDTDPWENKYSYLKMWRPDNAKSE